MCATVAFLAAGMMRLHNDAIGCRRRVEKVGGTGLLLSKGQEIWTTFLLLLVALPQKYDVTELEKDA